MASTTINTTAWKTHILKDEEDNHDIDWYDIQRQSLFGIGGGARIEDEWRVLLAKRNGYNLMAEALDLCIYKL